MASEILKHDENTIRVLGAITDNAAQEIRMLRVDPVTGRLLVSGSGGSISGQEISFTGAINGSNTAYTVATQPTYVVADGVWFKAADGNGNVQWSYSTGTVTMINPPSSSIYGF